MYPEELKLKILTEVYKQRGRQAIHDSKPGFESAARFIDFENCIERDFHRERLTFLIVGLYKPPPRLVHGPLKCVACYNDAYHKFGNPYSTNFSSFGCPIVHWEKCPTLNMD